MSSFNQAALLAKLQEVVNKSLADGSSEVADILSLALSGEIFNETNIVTVLDVDRLPNLSLYSSPSGIICFISSLNIFAISATGARWLTLDGRLIRQDTIYSDVWAWGCNIQGPLGSNNDINRSSPVSTVGGFTDWTDIANAQGSSLGIRKNGTLWSWGSGSFGLLGNNCNSINRSSPVSVLGGFTDWCCVSANFLSAAALRANGTLWAWGYNLNGRLGDGTSIARSSPVSVVGGITDWCRLSVGRYHTAAIRSNGTLWTWGTNSVGQLGDGTSINRSSPVSVVGGLTQWTGVAAGAYHTIGINNGRLWAWGNGVCSAGGHGDTILATCRSSPASVISGFTDWCYVTAGDCNSFAIRTNGIAYAWGNNRCGALGIGNTQLSCFPAQIMGGFTDWCAISTTSFGTSMSGYNRTAGIRTNGTVWGWGHNISGGIGDNTTVNRSSPVQVTGGINKWSKVSVQNSHTAAIRTLC